MLSQSFVVALCLCPTWSHLFPSSIQIERPNFKQCNNEAQVLVAHTLHSTNRKLECFSAFVISYLIKENIFHIIHICPAIIFHMSRTPDSRRSREFLPGNSTIFLQAKTKQTNCTIDDNDSQSISYFYHSFIIHQQRCY